MTSIIDNWILCRPYTAITRMRPGSKRKLFYVFLAPVCTTWGGGGINTCRLFRDVPLLRVCFGDFLSRTWYNFQPQTLKQGIIFRFFTKTLRWWMTGHIYWKHKLWKMIDERSKIHELFYKLTWYWYIRDSIENIEEKCLLRVDYCLSWSWQGRWSRSSQPAIAWPEFTSFNWK